MFSEVRPGIFWIHPPGGGEVYVVRTREGLALVDSGFLEFKEEILGDMEAAGLDPSEIRLAFVTHQHCDHVGGLGWWRKAYDFPVVAHAVAAEAIERADPVTTAAEIPYTPHSTEFVPCPVTHQVRGDEQFTLGERTFEIIYAPGHTLGSIHIISDDLLFVGDTIFESGGIGWVDVHWGSNPADYVETINRLEPYLGVLALPGHGGPYTLEPRQLDRARDITTFYLPYDHGFGRPRPESGYEE